MWSICLLAGKIKWEKNVQKPSHDLFLLLQFLPALLFSAAMWLLSVPAVCSPSPPSLVLGFLSSDSPHATKTSWTPWSIPPDALPPPVYPLCSVTLSLSSPLFALQPSLLEGSSGIVWEAAGKITGVLVPFSSCSAVWLQEILPAKLQVTTVLCVFSTLLFWDRFLWSVQPAPSQCPPQHSFWTFPFWLLWAPPHPAGTQGGVDIVYMSLCTKGVFISLADLEGKL